MTLVVTICLAVGFFLTGLAIAAVLACGPMLEGALKAAREEADDPDALFPMLDEEAEIARAVAEHDAFHSAPWDRVDLDAIEFAAFDEIADREDFEVES